MGGSKGGSRQQHASLPVRPPRGDRRGVLTFFFFGGIAPRGVVVSRILCLRRAYLETS